MNVCLFIFFKDSVEVLVYVMCCVLDVGYMVVNKIGSVLVLM